MVSWLVTDDGDVGIFDATNSTRSRRKMIISELKRSKVKVALVFIECHCDDPELLEGNMVTPKPYLLASRWPSLGMAVLC